MAHHSNEEECLAALSIGMEKSRQSGHWLAAVFRIEDGKVRLERTCFNFPMDDFKTCVGLLERELEQEKGLNNTPLPSANLEELK